MSIFNMQEVLLATCDQFFKIGYISGGQKNNLNINENVQLKKIPRPLLFISGIAHKNLLYLALTSSLHVILIKKETIYNS